MADFGDEAGEQFTQQGGRAAEGAVNWLWKKIKNNAGKVKSAMFGSKTTFKGANSRTWTSPMYDKTQKPATKSSFPKTPGAVASSKASAKTTSFGGFRGNGKGPGTPPPPAAGSRRFVVGKSQFKSMPKTAHEMNKATKKQTKKAMKKAVSPNKKVLSKQISKAAAAPLKAVSPAKSVAKSIPKALIR